MLLFAFVITIRTPNGLTRLALRLIAEPLVEGDNDLVGASLIIGDALFVVCDGDMLEVGMDVGDKLDVGL